MTHPFDTLQKIGLPESVQVSGNFVHLWLRSPDGDSTDCQILDIRCINNHQACQIANSWCELVWGIKNIFGPGIKENGYYGDVL